MKRYFVGIDIGTYSSRGILLDENFQIAGDVSTPHGMDNPKPGWFEQDAEAVWWKDLCILSHRLLETTGIDPREIACIGVSALGTDCLPVDEDCNPLRPAILYGIDSRAGEEIRWLTDYYGEKTVQKLFGHPICSGDTATKILWIRRHEPDVYEKTAKFLTGSSFLTAKLTGEYVIDQFLAKGSFRPLYREDGSVNTETCGLYCRPDQIARVAFSTDVAGTVTAQVALETGFVEGTPVITGTGDSTSEAVSVGLVEPGTAFFQFGSSMFFYYCVDRFLGYFQSSNGSIKGGKEFTVPGTFCLGDGTNAAGTLTRWVRDTLYTQEYAHQLSGGPNAYSIMAEEAAGIPAGCEGLMMLPYIYGERSPIQDPQATGMLFGLKGSHTRAHINRAALEAVGYSVYQHLLLFTEMGVAPKRVITAGGGTRNRTWMQIICDMAGMPIAIPESYQCSAFGDAMMAAVGCGKLEDFRALRRALPAGTVLKPNEKNHMLYASRYPLFRELYLRNQELMRRCETK